jgi:ketosteroid isomerase-like protein
MARVDSGVCEAARAKPRSVTADVGPVFTFTLSLFHLFPFSLFHLFPFSLFCVIFRGKRSLIKGKKLARKGEYPMKKVIELSLIALAVVTLACTPPANTNTATNTNSNTNTAPKAAAPTAEALLAMETKAWEAWKNKDAKHFEGIMADNFVSFERGKRQPKAEVIKMIAGHPCDIKSFTVSDPKVTNVSSDVVAVTYRGTTDGMCEGKKIPSPVTAASVWVRSGDTWKAAYHGEVPVVEPAAATAEKPAAEKKEEAEAEKKAPAPPPPAEGDKSAANSNSNANSAGGTSDALTDALMAMEKKGWEAWMKQDAASLQNSTTKDLTFVDSSGKATHGQAEVIKRWTDGTCKVSSVDVSDGKGSMIADNVALFTYKGSAVGTCGSTKLAPLWVVTVAVKEGDTWRASYIFEMPTS